MVEALLCSLGRLYHRHLRKIDWLLACTACLVCIISTVSGCRKKLKMPSEDSSGHITKLKQSILFRYLWTVWVNAQSIFLRCLCLKWLIFKAAQVNLGQHGINPINIFEKKISMICDLNCFQKTANLFYNY